MALGLVPWIVRNVLLSGCPFYPSPVGALAVDWRVKADAVEWIMAPMHFGVWPWYAFVDPHWYYTRLDSLGWIAPDVLVPTAIALAAMLLGLVLWLMRLVRRRPPATPRLSPLLLLPALASFAFVAKSAPMPRYMGATFWLLAAESIVLLMGRAAFGAGSSCRRLAATIVLISTISRAGSWSASRSTGNAGTRRSRARRNRARRSACGSRTTSPRASQWISDATRRCVRARRPCVRGTSRAARPRRRR
jgi:hypothetical protein